MSDNHPVSANGAATPPEEGNHPVSANGAATPEGEKRRSGFISVVGRPNAGKSTLLNTLLGQKVLIVSDKPQTTRNRIRCILTEERGQIIFFDTPGMHKPTHRLGEYMAEAVGGSLRGVDAAVLVADAGAPFGKGDAFLLEKLKASRLPVILALNKTDILTKEQILSQIACYAGKFEFREVVPLSALRGSNTSVLLDLVFDLLPPGPDYYDADSVTTAPERFIVAETIREKLLGLTEDEIPHSLAVVIETMEEKKTLVKIEATILVERESQKGIVIGKNGALLREAGTLARQDIEKMLERKVLLKLWVKVRSNWRNLPEGLHAAGYNTRDLA
jgi:GTP-binding protein Era